VPFSRDMPIIFGWSEGFTHGDDRTKVRAAIQEKLGKYKLPLVVALDLFNPMSPFETTEHVVLGAIAFSVPLRLEGGRSGPPTLTACPGWASRRARPSWGTGQGQASGPPPIPSALRPGWSLTVLWAHPREPTSRRAIDTQGVRSHAEARRV
jgi:hypothetical protein